MPSAIYINQNELPTARRAAAQAILDETNIRAVSAEAYDAAEAEAKRIADVVFDRPEYLINLLANAFESASRTRAVEAAVVAAVQQQRRRYGKEH